MMALVTYSNRYCAWPLHVCIAHGLANKLIAFSIYLMDFHSDSPNYTTFSVFQCGQYIKLHLFLCCRPVGLISFYFEACNTLCISFNTCFYFILELFVVPASKISSEFSTFVPRFHINVFLNLFCNL